MAKREAGIVHPADVVWVMIGHQQPQERGYTPARGRVLTFASSEWTRDHREKRPINQGVPVNQKESGAVWTFHRVNIKRPRPALRTGALQVFSRSTGVAGILSAVVEPAGRETPSRSVWSASNVRFRRRTQAASCTDGTARPGFG